MNKKKIFIIILLVILLYPIISIFLIEKIIDNGPGFNELQGRVTNYQISIWLTWLMMVIVAVYYKWISQRNFFFHIVYAFVIIAYSVFGFYYQRTFNLFDLPSAYNDSYSLGVFIALQNIMVAGVLTVFLQAAVWWFTRKWHRR